MKESKKKVDKPATKKVALSPWKAHVERWKDCQACPLHLTRTRIVIARGTVPCDVCFVGEAPGVSEDFLGQPFVGPAGILFDQMVRRALEDCRVCMRCRMGNHYVRFGAEALKCPNGHDPMHRVDLKLAFTNLLCCVPKGEGGHKVKEPPEDSIEACKPRLEEFLLTVAKPKVVIVVGKVPYEWLEPGLKHSVKTPKKCYVVRVDHPAAILRAPLAQQSLMRQRVVVNIRSAVERGLALA